MRSSSRMEPLQSFYHRTRVPRGRASSHSFRIWQYRSPRLSALLFCPHMVGGPSFAFVGVCSILAWLPRRQIPESPRWYEAQGRAAEAERTITLIEDEVRMATGARLSEPRQALSGPSDNQRPSFTELFRGRLLRRTLVAIWLMICMNAAIYTFVAWLPDNPAKAGCRDE